MPKVSVVVPVRDAEPHLDQCLGSIAAQTLPADDIELIVVDDSRNAGLDQATGEYVFFLDPRDWLAPTALEALVGIADRTGSGVVLPRTEIVESDRPRTAPGPSQTAAAVDVVASRVYRTYSTEKLYRSALLRDHNLRFPSAGPADPFTLEAYFLSPHVSVAGDQPYCFVRWREDNSLADLGPGNCLTNNTLLIELIEKYCHAKERRIPLLQGPVLGSTGVAALFGPRFLVQFEPDEQRDVFDHAHALLRRVWKPAYRREGTLGMHVLSSLVWQGDFDAVVEVSWMIRNKAPLPVLPADGRHRPTFVASTGTRVKDALTKDELAPYVQAQRERRKAAERRRRRLAMLAHPARLVQQFAGRRHA